MPGRDTAGTGSDDVTKASDTEREDNLIKRHKSGHWIAKDHRENIRRGCDDESDTERGGD